MILVCNFLVMPWSDYGISLASTSQTELRSASSPFILRKSLYRVGITPPRCLVEFPLETLGPGDSCGKGSSYKPNFFKRYKTTEMFWWLLKSWPVGRPEITAAQKHAPPSPWAGTPRSAEAGLRAPARHSHGGLCAGKVWLTGGSSVRMWACSFLCVFFVCSWGR